MKHLSSIGVWRFIFYCIAAVGFVGLLGLKETNSDFMEGARNEIVAQLTVLTKQAFSRATDPANLSIEKSAATAPGPGLLLPEPAPPVMPAACVTRPADRPTIVVGDKIQIRFFEKTRLAQPATTAAKVGEAVFERLDLASVYDVDEGGEVGIPLLGRIEVRDLTLPCAEVAVAQRFFESARSSIVSVSARFSSRPPVLVRGAVRSPGSYNFLPGMTIESLVAAAGSPLDGGIADLRVVEELLDRGAGLERQALGIELAVRRAEAELAGSRELVLDESFRRRITSELGAPRLKAEEATLVQSVGAAEATDAAAAAMLAGYDQRIKLASEQLKEVQQHVHRIGDRVSELRKLRERGYTSMNVVDDRELSAITLDRSRLTSISEIASLRAAREDAAQRATIAAAEQRQRRERQLRDVLERKNETEAQLASVERQLARLSGRSPPGPQVGLSAVIRRARASGAIDIPAEPGTQLQPGDIVAVAIKVPLSEHLVASSAAAPSPVGGTQVKLRSTQVKMVAP